MSKIVIISASIREGRNSHRVALYFSSYLAENKLGETEILDLRSYNFPLFSERLKYQKKSLASATEFAEKVRHADGVIIITPEYNGGYPASLKNVIDLLTDEWNRKPVAICTVSDGNFGGTQVITSLQFTLWKMKAWTVNAMYPVPKVTQSFDENGVAADKESSDKRAAGFVGELLWCIGVKAKTKN